MGKTYIISGFYGSGKTEFCVNLAMHLAKSENEPVTIADLDVINPYFRSREQSDKLKAHGISIMGNALGNNTGQDLPAVSYAFTSRIINGENVILDLAGGTAGIRLLSHCYDAIYHAKTHEFLCVLNPFRPETKDAAAIASFVKEVNEMSKLGITGFVNNGSMLRDTTKEHVLYGQEVALKASDMLNIPLEYSLINSQIYNEVKGLIASKEIIVFEQLAMRKDWQ